jgi:DNA-nicking Smr family endonuclease
MSDQDKKNSESEETALFRDAVRDATPLAQNSRVDLRAESRHPAKRPAKPRTSDADIFSRLSDDFIPPCDTHLEFMRPGVQRTLFKQLRTGKLPIEAHLDLHGHTRDAARQQLLQCIHQAQQQHQRVICIVHGKGYHSEDNRPVLKAMVNKWLQDLPEVLAFASAQPKDGGSGAVYVLLRQLKPVD